MATQNNKLLSIGETPIFGEWVRSLVFWSLDFLAGSPVRKHYTDIENMMENGCEPNIIKAQEDNLNNLLKYATENVEFYKQFKGFNSLKAFPIINKNIIRDNYEAFQSPKVWKHAVDMQTSGSTGTPFTIRQDKNKRDRVYAEMMYFWGKAGYRVGMRYVFFRIRNPVKGLTAWARNVLMLSIQRQDDENFEFIRKTLKADRKIRMILGYPSALNNFANYLLICGDTADMYNIDVIIGYGEAFPKSSQMKLKKLFDCNVVSLYSNQENGMLAMQCVENKEFHVNSASFFIELLKLDADEPAGIGEAGRIVVTDLFNYATPLIRYDTGDTAIWKEKADCDWCSPTFASVEGQATDLIYDTHGRGKSPHTVSVLMGPFDKLLQYQFIQENEKRYTLRLNGAKGCYSDDTFIKLFKDFLGEDAEIKVEHVCEITVLASGKRKEVVNRYRRHKPEGI